MGTAEHDGRRHPSGERDASPRDNGITRRAFIFEKVPDAFKLVAASTAVGASAFAAHKMNEPPTQESNATSGAATPITERVPDANAEAPEASIPVIYPKSEIFEESKE